MQRRVRSGARAFLVSTILSLLLGCGSSNPPVGPDFEGWPSHGGTALEQRFSPLAAISPETISRLGLAWSAGFDTNRGQEATPIVVDGVMYVSTAWSKVYALDAQTGRQLWRYDPEVPGQSGYNACCDVVNRGVAVGGGKVFVGTIDGRLIALEATTGKVAWSMQTTDVTKPYTITGAPRLFKNKVIIGNGGAEYGVRGYVTAYDQSTGKQAWRFYTVPGDPSKGLDGAASDEIIKSRSQATWSGRWYNYGGGGTVWDSIVYDPELDQIYIGVGNGSPWNHRIRSDGKGDNLFLASIVALDPETGRYRWHYQVNPAESWDFTATQQMTLATLKIGGKDRKVLMQAPKNGFFYVLDRQTGQLISARNFVPVSWATGIDMKTGRPIEVPAARYAQKTFVMSPPGIGAHSWHPMAFSPQTGLVYIPAQIVGIPYTDDPNFKFKPGRWNTGVALAVPPDDPKPFQLPGSWKGLLIAWDPVAQKEVWRVTRTLPFNGGVLATAGNLVFQGTLENKFEAYSADTGKKVWSFDTGNAVLAGAIAYEIAGTEYIAVVIGYGGSYGLAAPGATSLNRPNGRVLVFKLDGKATLPVAKTPPLQQPSLPKEVFSEQAVRLGAQKYAENCWVCHGPAAKSQGVVPDLRRSAVLADRAAWQSVVIGGALTDRGMVSFKSILKPADAEAVRGYVGRQAGYLKTPEPDRRSAADTRPSTMTVHQGN